MYHVNAQGVDDRMINVHYYYYPPEQKKKKKKKRRRRRRIEEFRLDSNDCLFVLICAGINFVGGYK